MGKGAVTYEDTAALPGCTYTYYVLPVHREMQVGGEQVKGPATQEITVTTPEAVIDVEIPAPSPHVDSSPVPSPSPSPVRLDELTAAFSGG